MYRNVKSVTISPVKPNIAKGGEVYYTRHIAIDDGTRQFGITVFGSSNDSNEIAIKTNRVQILSGIVVEESKMKADFEVETMGSIVSLRPLNGRALAWIEKHIEIDVPELGTVSLGIYTRYIVQILSGIVDEGLSFTAFNARGTEDCPYYIKEGK